MYDMRTLSCTAFRFSIKCSESIDQQHTNSFENEHGQMILQL